MQNGLWKYCSSAQETEYLLSLDLAGALTASREKQAALLYALSNHAEEHYRRVRIPKKHGGFRTLDVPDRLLKSVQQRILTHVLEHLPVPECARAYRKGVSLLENAEPHAGQRCVLKLDIRDFFGSITYLSVYSLAFPGEFFPPAVRTLLTHLCCLHDSLPQGAPTSPYISNLVMAPFDRYISGWCEARGITYTRYCDDLTFSGDFNPNEVKSAAEGFLLRLGFELNPDKTRFFSSSRRQEVTGIVVNDRPHLSKSYRRKLRQEWYFLKKYGTENHLQHMGSPLTPEKYLQSLKGRILYVLSIDPGDREFADMLRELSAERSSI